MKEKANLLTTEEDGNLSDVDEALDQKHLKMPSVKESASYHKGKLNNIADRVNELENHGYNLSETSRDVCGLPKPSESHKSDDPRLDPSTLLQVWIGEMTT